MLPSAPTCPLVSPVSSDLGPSPLLSLTSSTPHAKLGKKRKKKKEFP